MIFTCCVCCNTRLWQLNDPRLMLRQHSSLANIGLLLLRASSQLSTTTWAAIPTPLGWGWYIRLTGHASGNEPCWNEKVTYRRPYPISADVKVIGKYCDRGNNTIAIVGVILNVLRTWLTYLSHRVAHQFEYTWNPKWCSRSYHYSDLNDCQIENLQCVILKVLSVPFIPDFLKTQAHIINKSVSKLQII